MGEGGWGGCCVAGGFLEVGVGGMCHRGAAFAAGGASGEEGHRRPQALPACIDRCGRRRDLHNTFALNPWSAHYGMRFCKPPG